MTQWRWVVLAIGLVTALSRQGLAVGRGQSPALPVTPIEAERLREQRWAERTFSAWGEANQRKRATAALRDAPGTVSTITALLEQDRPADAIGQLIAATKADPPALIAALSATARLSYRLSTDESHDYESGLREVVDRAKARIPSLPREQAADLAYAVLPLETKIDQRSGRRDTWRGRAQALVEAYRGTAAALTVELDLLSDSLVQARNPAMRTDQMDQFWRSHPASVAGAHALYLKGNALREGQTVYNVAHQPDPTDRLEQLVAIVDELQSGQYPDCEWVTNAPELVSGFYVFQPETILYAPGNLERSLAAYQHFVETQFPKIRAEDPIESSVGYTITTRMGDLYARLGDRAGGIEQTLAGIEAHGGDRAEVDLFRAQLILNQMGTKGADKPDLNARAAQILNRLITTNEGYPARKALILLAAIYRTQNNLPGAIDAYHQFVTRYPSSPFAWLASIFSAQCLEQAGETAAAIAAYEALGTTYSQEPLAEVIGPASAAQLLDAQFAFDRSLTLYRRALNAWDNDYLRDVTPPGIPRPTPTATEAVSAQRMISQQGLLDRIGQLERSEGSRAGADIERGRWQLDALDFSAAVATLTGAEHKADGEASAEARALRHRAQLELVLDRLRTKGTTSGDTLVAKDLAALTAESFDTATGAAGVARALLTAQNGDPVQARQQLQTTLDTWLESQAGLRSQAPSPIDADVAALRALIIQPTGALSLIRSGAESAQFNQFPSDAQYVLLRPDVTVKTADGQTSRHVVYQQLPDFPRALFCTQDEQALLVRVVLAIGGLQPAPPPADPETGIEPAPGAYDVTTLLAQFLPMPQANFRSWSLQRHLEADPTIFLIEFTSADRTRANVGVAYGYQGATVMCEKIDGKWRAIKVVNRWIS